MAGADEWADELVKQVGEFGTKGAKGVVLATLHAVETKVVPLSATLEMAREKEVDSKVELYLRRVAAKLATEDHNDS